MRLIGDVVSIRKKRGKVLAPKIKESISELANIRLSNPIFEHEPGAARIKEGKEQAVKLNRFTAVVDLSKHSWLFDLAHEWSHEAQAKKGLGLGPVEDLHAQVLATLALDHAIKREKDPTLKDELKFSLKEGLNRFRGSEYVVGTVLSKMYMDGRIKKDELLKLIRSSSKDEFFQTLEEIRENHKEEILKELEKMVNHKKYEYLAHTYKEFWETPLHEKAKFIKKLKS